MKKYIRLVDGFQPQKITIEELIEEYPDVDFCDPEYQETSDEVLAKYNVYELYTAPKPKYAGDYVEGPPIFLEDVKRWAQNWVKHVPAPWE